jgi:hypothetical protein
MAEKNFKITGGLALGDYALTANALSLLWDGNAIATQAYVDSATPTVNTNAIAESLASATLWISEGDNLNVNVNAFVSELDGLGLYVDGVTLAVNTNAIADSLASGTLWVSEGDNLNVNVNAFVGDLAGTGLYVNGVTLAVNTNVFATKGYVDSLAQGLDVKASVIVASTENIDLTVAAPATIDGISLVPGDRVLLKNQTNATENGIYVLEAAGPNYSLVRSADANDLGLDLTSGAFTFVEGGTENAGKGFVASVSGSPVLGFSATWTQFSDTGALTAGSGIYFVNGAITANVNALAGSGLSNDYGQISVNAGTGIFIEQDYVTVNVNAIAGTGLVGGYTLGLDQYAAGVRYDGTSGSGGNASVTVDTLYATTATSNTYVTLGTIGANKAFTFDVLMNVGSLLRKSTISGVTDSLGLAQYSEYAIVDTDTPITAPDFYIQHDLINNLSTIKAKATLDVDSLYVVVNSQIISLVS